MASNQAMNSWEQIRQGVSDVERLIGQKAYNLAMIKARQTLEIMVKTLMKYYGVEASDLSEAINRLYEAHVISGKTRDNYHRIRILGNTAAHDGNSNASDANNSYHLLSQEVYTFANMVKSKPGATVRRRTTARRHKKSGVFASFDSAALLKILIPVLIVILIIVLIKVFSGRSKEEEVAETTEMQIEYVTIAETEPMTMPEPETEPLMIQVWTTNDYLRVRKEPSTEAEILTTLNPDTQVEYIEAAGEEWSKIMYEGQEAYVSTQFLTMIEVPYGETLADTPVEDAAPEEAPAE